MSVKIELSKLTQYAAVNDVIVIFVGFYRGWY